jgi:hypothetical protein
MKNEKSLNFTVHGEVSPTFGAKPPLIAIHTLHSHFAHSPMFVNIIVGHDEAKNKFFDKFKLIKVFEIFKKGK